MQLTLGLSSEVTSMRRKRRSYTREEKLKIVRYYNDNGKNLYQTCKHFNLNSRTVKRWIDGKKATKESKKGRKRVQFARRPKYAEMEEKLYESYKELRKKGLKMKK